MNKLDKFDIGHCPMKVTAQLFSKFFPFTIITTLGHVWKLWFSNCVHVIIIYNIYVYIFMLEMNTLLCPIDALVTV